jgi:hypothetical protein
MPAGPGDWMERLLSLNESAIRSIGETGAARRPPPTY